MREARALNTVRISKGFQNPAEVKVNGNGKESWDNTSKGNMVSPTAHGTSSDAKFSGQNRYESVVKKTPHLLLGKPQYLRLPQFYG
jgi:hypothetical protein